MNTFLLGIIIGMVLVTMISSIMTTIMVAKYAKMEDLAKSLLKIFGIVFAVFAVIAIAAGVSTIKKDDSNNATENNVLETSGFNKLSIDNYLKLIKEDEKNIILIARPTCYYCELFTPILKEAAEDMDLVINYVNTDEFSSDDWSKFESSLSYFSEEDWGTPLTLIVQNGKVVADNGGYVELDTIKAFFKDNGLGE